MFAIPMWLVSPITLLLVLLAIEGGFRLGRASRKRSEDEKESPVSAITGTVLAMLAFIMAFTFGIVSDRYDMRKGLIREEAGAIRTAWLRSDFLPEPDRGQAVRLIREYVDGRLAAVQSGNVEQVMASNIESERIHRQMWDMAVTTARADMNSDVAALYVESLNELINVHAMRVSVGLHARIPLGIWMALYSLIVLSMFAVGYHTAIAGSKRTWMLLVLALSFSMVITLIGALDRAQSGYLPVSQQPLEALRGLMGADSSTSPE